MKFLNSPTPPPLKRNYQRTPCNEGFMAVNLDKTNTPCRLFNYCCVTWNLAEPSEIFMTIKHNCHERNVYDRNKRTQVTTCRAAAQLMPLCGKCSNLHCFHFCSVISGPTTVHVQQQHKTTGRSKEGPEWVLRAHRGCSVACTNHRDVVGAGCRERWQHEANSTERRRIEQKDCDTLLQQRAIIYGAHPESSYSVPRVHSWLNARAIASPMIGSN